MAKESIKICFVSYRAYPIFNPSIESVFGGAEVDLYLLATELAKDDAFQVSFVVGDFGQDDEETREGVRLIKSLDPTANFFAGSPKVWRAMRKADADIYFDEACSLGTVLYAFYCRVYGKKFVYRTAHSRECNGRYIKENPFRGRAVKWAFASADKLIVQNHEDLNNLKRTMKLEAEAIKNASRMPEIFTGEKETVLWVGRSAPVKRPELFIKLAKELPEQKLVMVCPEAAGDDNYEKLKELASEAANLEFIEKVPFQQVGEYFAKAKVYVSTSESEGFPNTFLQACENSTAILSLEVNPDDFLDRNNCGLCSDGDWDKFVVQLKEMLDGQTAAEYGQNAKNYLEQNHDIKKIVQRYKAIFRELVGISD